MENIEIERKWLLDSLPDLPYETDTEMEQGYIAFEPSTVRIRSESNGETTNYMLNFKSGGTLQRTEVEIPLTAKQYAALRTMLAGPPAYKRHRTCTLPGGYRLECNEVDAGKPDGFCYAEVEFESVEQANAFVPPPFLQREVTEQPGHSMAAYCRLLAQKQQLGNE